ncbi:MAG: hypothetical protein ACOC33_00165 [bacterium]
MPRPKKNKINLDEETLKNLVQECYDDSRWLRGETNTLLTKWKSKLKDNEDLVALGKEVVSLINQQDKIIGKKLELVKILKEVVLAANKKKEEIAEIKDSISDEEMNKLNELIINIQKNKIYEQNEDE